MNKVNNIIFNIFSGATETRSLEFKEGFNWEAQESVKSRDELVKAILAMSNTPGGGTIILGIRTDTKQKKIFPEGFLIKDAQSFTKNEEHIKTIVHGYCQRPIDFDIQQEPHPKDESRWFVIVQVREFDKWPTITVKHSNTKENDNKTYVIENRAMYTRSKLAQWASIKAGPQEIEDIVDIAVKKYDVHIQSLGYTRNKPREKQIDGWISNQQKEAINGLTEFGIKAYFEVIVKIVNTDLSFEKTKLREAARDSTVPTFGWPIAIYLDNNAEYRPAVITEGIRAIVPINRDDFNKGKTFDYWAIHESGAFYTLTSLFEDLRNPHIISFNTRIVKITELFMYLRNLYTKLEIGRNISFEVTIKHVGLKGRKLSTLSPNRLMFPSYVASQDELTTLAVTTNINEFEEDPTGIVKRFTGPLFEIFDFFKLDDKVLEQIVTDYLSGKVT